MCYMKQGKIELSMEQLKDISIRTAKEIAARKNINLIIYIARAGFPIAYYMNEVFQCRILGIKATRSGSKIKAAAGKYLLYLPETIKDIFREIELKLKIHERHSARRVEFHQSLNAMDLHYGYSILVVDDSVDTGNSMKQVLSRIIETFPYAEITTYALNVFDTSRSKLAMDYFTFKNAIIRTPMSKDSHEYSAFYEMYQRETSEGYI